MTFLSNDRTWQARLVVEVAKVPGYAAAVGRATKMLGDMRARSAWEGDRLAIGLTIGAPDPLSALAWANSAVLETLERVGVPGCKVIGHDVEEELDLVGLDDLIAQL